jgi:DNA replication protein DnaC
MERINSILARTRHKAVPKQDQLNTLASIKKRLENGNDRESVKDEARQLENTTLWVDAYELFSSTYPVRGRCPECGKDSPCIVHPFTLAEKPYCEKCATRNELLSIEKERNDFIKAFLSRADVILKENGAPSMFLKTLVSEPHPYIKKYAAMKKGLYICGDRGTGKTHMAVALMREHLNNITVLDRGGELRINIRNVPVFVSVPELLLEIRSSYSDGKSSEKLIIDKYTDRDFMVMDDLGIEKTTEWAMQILYIIIDRRYREDRRTVFTSNLTLDEIADKLDDRIASRIAGMCVVVPFKGKDRRVGLKGSRCLESTYNKVKQEV